MIELAPGALVNGTPPDEKRRAAEERARIDRSCRWPVLAWAGSALCWLLLGSLYGLTASIKLHSPEWLFPDISWMTFGRIRPVHLTLVGIGWGSMAGVAVAIWMMCRLSRVELFYPKMLVFAAALFDLGIFFGFTGILAGYSTGVEWLEFPPWSPPFLVAGLGLVSAWTVATFRRRRERHVYVTQWYLLGAMFWMPWQYTTATMLIIYVPATGVVQAAVNWWFAHNYLGLWLTPMGVGTAYYLIPKVIGRPVYSYYLSILGFWSLALFYSWAGMHHLIGGPLPAWMISVSIVGSVCMFIPVIAVAVNHHMTMQGYFHLLRYSPTLRFVVFGAVTYTAVSLQGALEATREVSEVAHFTHYTVGHAHLGVYGFFSMVMFGAFYYIIPRMTGWEWHSRWLIRAHFWLTASGITLYFSALTVGGWYQGLSLIQSEIPFMTIVRGTVPYLVMRTVGGSLMTLGHLVFAYLFVANLMHWGRPRLGPAYFVQHPTAPGAERAVAVAS